MEQIETTQEIDIKRESEAKAVVVAAVQKPTVGRIVLYYVSSDDAEIMAGSGRQPATLPAVVVNDHNGGTAINLKVFCDAPFDVWRNGVTQGTKPGQWSWPPRS